MTNSDETMNSWYDWLVSHTSEPVKNTASAAHTAFKERVDALHEAARVPPAIKEGMNAWYDWLVSHTPAPIRKQVSRAHATFKNTVESLYKRKVKTTKVKSALKRFAENYIVEIPGSTDPQRFLMDVRDAVKEIWDKKSVKTKLILECVIIKTNFDREDDEENAGFHSLTEVVLPGSDHDEIYAKMTGKIMESFANYLRDGSSWRLKKIKRLNVHTSKFKPMKGSSWIPLPEHLARKKAIVNVKNMEDHECFKWAVSVARMEPHDHPERLTKKLREFSETMDWTGVSFPTDLKQIKKFSKNNGITINVFVLEGIDVEPLLVQGNGGESVVNLLLISDDKTKHYVWIKDMSRLLSSRINMDTRCTSVTVV